MAGETFFLLSKVSISYRHLEYYPKPFLLLIRIQNPFPVTILLIDFQRGSLIDINNIQTLDVFLGLISRDVHDFLRYLP